MRCARCDRIAVPQVLARTPEGELVFGWCPSCLAAEGCVPVETEGDAIALTVRERRSPRRTLRRSWIRLKKWQRMPRSMAANRRLATLGVSGLMGAWALILAFVGGLKLTGPGRGKGIFLLCGSGLMALVSLAVWFGVIDRNQRVVMTLRVTRVATVVIAFGTLAWGIVRHDPHNDPIVIGVVAGSIAVSWLARRLEQSHGLTRTRETVQKI